jgi:small ligand-binding sensory domain FIST
MTTVSAPLFRHGHASHPDWRMAAQLALAQIDAQMGQDRYSRRGALGLIYISDHFAEHASEILTLLKSRTGIAQWAGGTGLGVFASGIEYFDEPALSVMLLDLPNASAQVFSGVERAPGLEARNAEGALMAHTALVHADPATHDLDELIVDLASRTHSGYLFGGIMSSRGVAPQFANQTFSGGLSGVMFASSADVRVRITQGCHPIAPTQQVTRGKDNWLFELDGQPALDGLLRALKLPTERLPTGEVLRSKLQGGLFVGMDAAQQSDRTARFSDYVVRGVVGIDPARRALALADAVTVGQRLAFCRRDADAAKADLVRILTELREAMEEDRVTPRGAVYVSCTGRGAHLFGEPSVELKTIAHHLGDIPLTGFAANGEIGRHHLYGFTGVLAVFV